MEKRMKEINDIMEQLSTNSRDFYISSSVPRLSKPPTPLEFYRDYISYNRPVIIENALNHWPAITKWNESYLIDKLKDKELSVAITPNGLADSTIDDLFVLPYEEKMTMKEYVNASKNTNSGSVYYIQKQNSNLTTELSVLIDDVDAHIPWASEAMDREPDAVNFWMGDHHSITSLHKDPYENLYAVIKGSKTFLLLPPTDICHIPYRNFQVGQYKRNIATGEFEIDVNCDGMKTPWISLDQRNPISNNCKLNPIICTVSAGELLYLPSLWFHQVKQSDQTIAVNYWYDMNYDSKYCYFQAVSQIAQVIRHEM